MRAHPLFEKVNGEIYADPSMWRTDQQQMGGAGVPVSLAEAFENEGVYLAPAAANGQMADELLVNRLNYDYWHGLELGEFFEPRLKIFDTCEQTIAHLPTLRYEEWAKSTEKALKEKILDNGKVDEFDAIKYMVVSAIPESTKKPQMRPPAGSYRELLNQIYKSELDRKMQRS
jgi:hypothetical protein